jgi:hypothetical protein
MWESSVWWIDGRMFYNGMLRCPGTRYNRYVQQTGAGRERAPLVWVGPARTIRLDGRGVLLYACTFVRNPESDQAIIEDDDD